MKLVTAAEMRAIEEEAFAAGATPAQLMENAGRAVAEAVRERLGGVRAQRIVVLVGPGNNGGDGLVAARHLYDFGAEVIVYLLAPRDEADANLQAVRSRDIELAVLANGEMSDDERETLHHADAVIDAVLGTGRPRPLEGAIANVFDLLKDRRAVLFAVDLPTGINADTGAADPHTAEADITLTLGFSKVGLHLLPGSHYAGEVAVLDIGLRPDAGESLATELLTREWAKAALPGRPQESNKGTFGRVLIVAGSMRYTGAAALSALGALRAGAGLVTLAAIPAVRAAVAALVPEVTFLPLPEEDDGIAAAAGDLIAAALPGFSAMLIGPGLGLASGTQAVVRGVLSSPQAASVPAVVDADGLNALSRMPGWSDAVKLKAVLTPHPGELGRLVSEGVPSIQEHRVEIARNFAREWHKTVVLKGAHTIIARPDGDALISPYATAVLATAGTGDVLAGAIAGLIAQGVEPADAAGLAVYLHGKAAESYREAYGDAGLLASELAPAIARAAHMLRRE